ncbi:MAG: rhomboid family intramembrane serine protease [Gammaproteobacteria bacterium]
MNNPARPIVQRDYAVQRDAGSNPHPLSSPRRGSFLPPMLLWFPVTSVISLVCVALFAMCYIWGYRAVFAWVHFPELTDSAYLWQVWRWLTPAVFHFGFVHILVNVLWWFILGRVIEVHQGSARLLILFVAAALIPNFAQYVVGGTNFGGLSGVVYGLFGYVWVYGHLRPGEGLFVSMSVMVQILAWLVLGFTGWLEALGGFRMANAAHLGGLLVGAFLALLYAKGGPSRFLPHEEID